MIKRILLHIVVLVLITTELGLLTYVSRKIVQNFIVVDISNAHIFKNSLFEVMHDAFFLCCIFYSLYLILVGVFKAKKLKEKVGWSFLEFVIMIIMFASGGFANFGLYFATSLAILCFAAISIPFIERAVFNKVG